MNVATILGAASTVALWTPVVLILVLQMWKRRGLLALLFYYSFMGLTNARQQKMIPLPKDVYMFINILGNFLDVPLILLTLTAFAMSAQVRKQMLVTIVVFLVYGAFTAFSFGWNHKSAMYAVAPGIFVVMWYSIIHFSHYTRMAIERNRGMGQSMMCAAIFFAYGTYVIVYYFSFMNEYSTVRDIIVIYYVANLLSAVLMSIGLIYLHRHDRQIKEVQRTRRELAMFFDH